MVNKQQKSDILFFLFWPSTMVFGPHIFCNQTMKLNAHREFKYFDKNSEMKWSGSTEWSKGVMVMGLHVVLGPVWVSETCLLG